VGSDRIVESVIVPEGLERDALEREEGADTSSETLRDRG
jgi:hypothetical protein